MNIENISEKYLAGKKGRMLSELLSKIPLDSNSDKEMMRISILAELDAINLYEQMAKATGNEKIKLLLLDVAKEEKTDCGRISSRLGGNRQRIRRRTEKRQG